MWVKINEKQFQILKHCGINNIILKEWGQQSNERLYLEGKAVPAPLVAPVVLL
jgi:hypothetical protein